MKKLSTELVVATLAVVLVALSTVAATYHRDSVYVVPKSSIQAGDGLMYIAPINAKTFPFDEPASDTTLGENSNLQLFEDGEPLGPAHTAHNVVRQLGAGRYSHWNNALWFSASDNSDPRSNNRTYIAKIATPIDWRIRVAFSLSAGLMLITAFAQMLRKFARSIQGVEAIATVKRETIEVLRCAWPFLPIAVAFGLLVSPLLTVDSQVLLGYPLSSSVVPHFPPMYPLLGKAIVRLDMILHGQFATSGWMFGPGAAKMMLLIQHLLTLLAAARLALQVSAGPLKARITTGLLYLNPITLASIQALLTEALVVPFVLAAVAEALIIGRGEQKLWRFVLFFLWACLAALTRHPAIVVILILPIELAVLLCFSAMRRTDRRLFPGLAKAVAVSAIGIIASLILIQAVESTIMWYNNIEQRSILGRVFVYRIAPGGPSGGSFADDDSERVAAVARLEAGAPNDTIRHTLNVMASTPPPWIGTFHRLWQEVDAECRSCSSEHKNAIVDRLMNDVSLYAIKKMDWGLTRDSLFRAIEMIAPARAWSNTNCCGSILLRGKDWHIGAQLNFRSFDPRPTFDQNLIRASFPINLEQNLGIILALDASARAYLFVVALPALLLAMAVPMGLTAIAFALMSTILAYCILVSVVTIYIARYGIFVDLLYCVAVIIIVAHALHLLVGWRLAGWQPAKVAASP
jgi:hypothetical protein